MTRILTAVAILVCSVVAAVWGVQVVRFVAWQKKPAEERTEAEYREWRDVPGLRAAAIAMEIRQLEKRNDPQSVRKQEAVLGQALELRPLATGYWLSLAEIGMVTLKSRKTVLADLEMSSISGPNELGVMWRRATFGILEWDILPPEARSRIADDLAGVTQTVIGTPAAYEGLRSLLAQVPEERRQDLTGMLRERLLTTDELAQLGLR